MACITCISWRASRVSRGEYDVYLVACITCISWRVSRVSRGVYRVYLVACIARISWRVSRVSRGVYHVYIEGDAILRVAIICPSRDQTNARPWKLSAVVRECTDHQDQNS